MWSSIPRSALGTSQLDEELEFCGVVSRQEGYADADLVLTRVGQAQSFQKQTAFENSTIQML